MAPIGAACCELDRFGVVVDIELVVQSATVTYRDRDRHSVTFSFRILCAMAYSF